MGKLIFVAIFMVFVVIAEFASSEVAAGAAVMVGSSGTKEEGDNKLVQEEEGDIDGGFSSLDGMLTWAIDFASSEVVGGGAVVVVGSSGAKEEADNQLWYKKRRGILGGFSSLDGMLQWAIGHSDPGVLKQRSEDVQRMSVEELQNRQTELKELMERLKMPSDAQLMQVAVNDLDNSSLPLEHHLRALEELLELVEPIDNAIDLQKLGGYNVLIRILNHSEPEIRTAAAWALGKASQNNPVVQNQVLELGALTMLMKMMNSHTAEETLKALFAISALIRNNLNGQKLFYQEGGDKMLQEVLSNSNLDIRLRKKSLILIADLAVSQMENENAAEFSVFKNQLLLKAIVHSMESTDIDLGEKALNAIENVLQIKSPEIQRLREFFESGGTMEKLKQELQQFFDRTEHITDVESYRKEVHRLFHQNLAKVTQAAI